jgi:hypothetical protein
MERKLFIVLSWMKNKNFMERDFGFNAGIDNPLSLKCVISLHS